MTLREPKPGEPTKQKLFRLPESLCAYIEKAAVRPMTETSIVASAVELDRDLAEKLNIHRARLAEYAAGRGLNLHAALADVLAELVLKGLEQTDREKKSNRAR